MRPHVPNMEVISHQISIYTTRVQNECLWILKKDLEYAYCQLNLSEKTSDHCNFAQTFEQNMKGY